MENRLRLAPSPTGLFHIGTARTALFNWAIASLSRFPSQVALQKLIPLLEDDNLEVVQRAILALGKLGEPEVLPILQAKLAEKREGIAQFVKIAISQLKCR